MKEKKPNDWIEKTNSIHFGFFRKSIWFNFYNFNKLIFSLIGLIFNQINRILISNNRWGGTDSRGIYIYNFKNIGIYY